MSRLLRGKTSTQTVLKARQMRRPLTASEQILWEALCDSLIYPPYESHLSWFYDRV
jgi:very-short-patch-repair endonuclease